MVACRSSVLRCGCEVGLGGCEGGAKHCTCQEQERHDVSVVFLNPHEPSITRAMAAAAADLCSCYSYNLLA